ncbi:MAG: hypothetical protein IPG90_21135 [Bacteroidetes bacterium]|nr:hypothetical protein [Bacteroidota bacterium]
MKKHFISILFLLQHFLIHGQSPENFQLVIEEDTIFGNAGIANSPFLHAGSMVNGLLIGGRTDGLHQRRNPLHRSLLQVTIQTFMRWIRNKNKCGQDH